MRTRRPYDVLLIDNYDSFTWNLYQYIAQMAPVRVLRNDVVDLDAVAAHPPSHIVISPGPKGPADAGVSLAAIRRFAGRISILGVCLGHQAINEAFGGATVRAPAPIHGKTSRIHTDGQTIFEGIPRQFEVCRYHSLVADPSRLGAGLTVSAWTDDGVIMGLRHAELGVEGVQFHPESFRTEHGMALLSRFLDGGRGSPLPVGGGPHRARADPGSPRGGAALRPGSRPSLATGRGDPLPFGPEGFWRCVEALRRESGFALLASTLPDARQGRWSIAVFSPVERVVARGGEITVHRQDTTETFAAEPLLWLEERAQALASKHPPLTSALPFAGGYLGFIGYEAGRRLELDAAAPGETPDLVLGYYNQALILDHHSGDVYAFGPRVAELLVLADGPPPEAVPTWPATLAEPSLSDEEYLAAIVDIQEYIRAGDVYQVNLTQRLRAPLGRRDPWHAFRRLARDNPAPFSAYLHFPELTVVSASPERFLAVEGDRVETRPIKGTAPRGATPEADAASLVALRESPKDRAELTMIVDLLRNDLGRVCVPGSVIVDAFPEHESYASVHHLVATITGTLAAGESVWSLLRASLPGGSITGAPKIRAMEIIDQLERAPRGVYTGAIGYIGANGRADLNIAIRTAIVVNDFVYVHGGGGVVIDSVPEAELAEARLKMCRVLDAFGMV